ncbi:MAG: tandem-95 repeat protein [Verrucomicrobiota bacterium]
MVPQQAWEGLQPIQKKIMLNLAQQEKARELVPAVCFAPGTPDLVVQQFYARNPQLIQMPFQLGPRWTATATGGATQQGDPTVLTWSIVPDGTSIPGSAGEPTSPSNLIAFFNGIYGSQTVWQALFQQVFDRWAALTGTSYVFQPSDDGAAFPGTAGALGVRGDVRIAGHLIDGNSGILAYNFFPNGGDMVIDTGDNNYNNVANNSRVLRNILAHEHGHGLGFPHVCPTSQTKLMEPFLSTQFDGPQHDDILNGQRNYGDAFEHNDSAGAATSLGVLNNGTLTTTNLSIDGAADVDFYSFTLATANKRASVTLRPVGFTYLEGPQNGDGSCTVGTTFNSLTINDLGVALLDSDGATVLATVNANPAGQNETLLDVQLPAISTGPFFVRVFGGATDNVQQYNFDLVITDGGPVQSMLSISDVAVTEGNSGSVNAVFNVTLVPAASQTVTVSFATADATASAGADYTAVTGSLTFAPGVTAQTITVPVLGDTLVEANETFQVNLSNPVNAAIADGTGVGTINDDDTLVVTGEPIAVIEGTGGTTNAVFLISLSGPSAQTVTVDYATTNRSATAGTDYTAASGTVTFLAGATNQTVSITVNSDLAFEGNEVFQLVLTNASTGVIITNGTIPCTIIDDDDSFFPLDLVVYPNRNPQQLVNALTAGGGAVLTVRSVSLSGHSTNSGEISSGTYALIGTNSTHTYGLTLPGVALSSGNVLDYQTGTNQINGFTTFFGPQATPAQETLLDPITGGSFTHFDVTQMDVNFDVSPTANQVAFRVVFGSEEWPDFVNSSFIDGFGIYLNGTNIAFTSGLPININHPDMTPIAGTELNAVIAPAGVAVMQFNAPIVPGSTNNQLTFIICDTADRALDTTIFISSLQAIEPPVESGAKPAITGFSPSSGPVGSAVVITGENFNPVTTSNIVYFGAIKAQVLTAATNSLTVRVPAGATYGPITVTANGLTAFADGPFDVTFLSNNSINSKSFSAKFDFLSAGGSRSVAVNDLNGDGRPDLVLANFAGGNVSILRNVTTQLGVNGGSFASRFDLATGPGANSVVLSDVNGDGLSDLVVANYDNATVSVFRNKSDSAAISFFSRADFATANNPRSVAVEDIDDDGKPDLIVANEGSGTISVLRNQNVAGSINQNAFADKIDFVAGSGPTSVAVGDIDGDGRPDIVVANGFNGPGGNSISILRNTGRTNGITSSSFAIPLNFAAGSGPISVALADVDGNGKLDIAVANSVSGTISLFENTSTPGSVAVALAASFGSGITTRSLAFGDVDGDGRPDLVVANQSIDRVAVLRNTHISLPPIVNPLAPPISVGLGANSFAPRISYVTGKDPYGIAVNDLDSDGKPELLVANQSGSVSLYKNLLKADPAIVWSTPADIVYGTPLSAAQLNAVGQFAGTNIPGTVVYSPGTGTVLGAGNGQTITAIFVPLQSTVFNIVTNVVQINVLPAPLTVTANSVSRPYGSANPAFVATYTGFVNGDTEQSLDTPPTFGTAATANSPVGLYTITASGTADANYDISHVNGILQVTPAPLTIRADDKSRAYGAPNPPLTATYTGFVNGENETILTSQVELDTDAMDDPFIRSFPITASGATAANYFITHVDGTLTVTSDDAPVVTLSAEPLEYTENDGAVLLDDGASVTDGGSSDFSGGSLTVTFASGGAAEDRLGIRNVGMGAGEIGTSSGAVFYSGVQIGAFTGGNSHTNPLVVSFNSAVTPGVAAALLCNLTYENVSENPSTTQRQVTLVISDGDGGISAPASRLINVTSVNDAPAATAQVVATPEDFTLNITLSGTDVEMNTLTFAVAAPPANGSLSGVAPNLVYRPATNFNGVDSFTFVANDGMADSPEAAITIVVNAVNDVPVASNVSVTTDEDTPANIVLAGSDVDFNSLTYTVLTSPTRGTLTGTGPNLVYTPGSNLSGADSFTYRVSDGQANSGTATVSITITPVNDAPTLGAIANPAAILEDAATQIVAFGGVSSGAANESQGLTVTAVSDNPAVIPDPAVQYVSPAQGGSVIYAPAANAFGTAIITVTVNDGGAVNATATRTFTVTVASVNDAPTLDAIANPAPIDEDAGTQTVQLTGISSGPANEGQVAVVTAVSDNPAVVPHPAVVYTNPNTTGSLTYAPVAGASGSATITVTVNDGGSPSGTITRTFQVVVTSVNDAPTLDAIPDPDPIIEDAGQQTINLTGITSGAADENQTLTVTAVSDNLAVIPNPSVTYTSPDTAGTLKFTPVANAFGTANITVTVSDGQSVNATTTRTFQLVVLSENDLPIVSIASPLDGASINAGTTINIDVSAADVDGVITKVELFDGATPLAEWSAPPYTYAWSGAALGEHVLTARATDSDGAEVTSAAVTITVNPAISSVSVGQTGEVTLGFIGETGVTYVVEVSSDLMNWTVIDTIVGTSGEVPIVDPGAIGAGLRFYRVRPQVD